MKTIILSIIFVFALCSCSAPTNSSDIEQANILCQSNGGLTHISKNELGDRWMVSIRCNNGARFEVFPDGVWKETKKK